MATQAKLKTYIQELSYEKRICRSLNNEASARPLNWGKLLESYVFTREELLGFEYRQNSDKVIEHPTIKHWCGTPDGTKDNTVFDLKCPWTMKSFCELEQITILQDIEYFKNEKPEYYWQLVSNSILTNSQFAELIVYCPYEANLTDIRIFAENYDGLDQYKYRFIVESSNDELPYLPEESPCIDLNIFRFEVPQSDKDLLISKISSIEI